MKYFFLFILLLFTELYGQNREPKEPGPTGLLWVEEVDEPQPPDDWPMDDYPFNNHPVEPEIIEFTFPKSYDKEPDILLFEPSLRFKIQECPKDMLCE